MRKIERIKDKVIIALVYLITIILAVLLLTSCDKKNPYGTYQPSEYKVYVIDSCEYVGICEGGQDDFLAHKGNCRFCAERNRRIIREQVDSILIQIFD